jgi:hypothetical protein
MVLRFFRTFQLALIILAGNAILHLFLYLSTAMMTACIGSFFSGRANVRYIHYVSFMSYTFACRRASLIITAFLVFAFDDNGAADRGASQQIPVGASQ